MATVLQLHLCLCLSLSLSLSQSLVNVQQGDLVTAKRLVYASLICSIGGAVLFSLTLLFTVITSIVYIRIVYLSDLIQ